MGNQSLSLRAGDITRTLATAPGHNYRLNFASRAAPAMEGLIAWWPAEFSAVDIVGGHNGFLTGNFLFVPAEVNVGMHVTGIRSGFSVRPLLISISDRVRISPLRHGYNLNSSIRLTV